jgi:LPXTG-motif cell wall-anchored protein
VGAGWPIALGVVLAASAGIYWYRRRYPETLIERRQRQAPQRLTN